ncbi:Protein Y57G11C.18 [Aphelenchoides avenae]|nr:Protein Y57G11C.18 [Aphelenchus avenae]
MVVSGPSSSGKSTWLLRFIRHAEELIDPPPAQILYAYGEYHNHVPELEKAGVLTHAGLPSEEHIDSCKKPLLLLLDDLMLVSSEQYLSNLYTKKSHHRNIFVCFLTQNLFDKQLKVARNNSQYIVLMKAPNAALQMRTLGAQLFPGRLPYFLDAYAKATEKNYGYLLLDLHAAGSPQLRLRTDIFPGEDVTVFIP